MDIVNSIEMSFRAKRGICFMESAKSRFLGLKPRNDHL